mgnify:CR=1 FL=1
MLVSTEATHLSISYHAFKSFKRLPKKWKLLPIYQDINGNIAHTKQYSTFFESQNFEIIFLYRKIMNS